MNHLDDDNEPGPSLPSVTERQLRRLLVPEPSTYDPHLRLDVIHAPDLDLLWGSGQ